MHTWGIAVALMLCEELMLKLRLWEELREWVGPIRSNRSAEAGPEPAAGAGARGGAAAGAVMAAKRSFPLVSTV